MTVRTTIYLSDELDARLRRLVPSRGLNRFINDVVSEKVAALEKERLVAEMREGYIATRSDRESLDEDWEAATLEEWPE
jgi:hypothetical protein